MKKQLTPAKPAITIITGNIETRQVFLGKKPLSAKHSQQVVNHSPDGFSWGYHGSGCAQLALAILLTRTGQKTATRLYQTFKAEFVATWPQHDFEVGVPLDKWIKAHGGKITPNENDFGFDNVAEESQHKCDVRCLYATGDDCDCVCGGKNHGSLAPNRQLKLA